MQSLLFSLLIAAQGAAPAPALRFDLPAGSLQVAMGDSIREIALPAPIAPAQWEEFVRTLAQGEWTLDAAREWGVRLFPPACEPLLRDATQWRIADPAFAGLDAVVLPWRASEPLLTTVRLDFAPREATFDRVAIERVLALAPFVEGSPLDVDIPDTLQAAWNVALRRLELLPRNDVDPASLRALLDAEENALLSLRATLPLPRGWSQQWEAAPPLRSWSQPFGGPFDGTFIAQDDFVAECEALLRGAALLWADRWPVAESARGGDYIAVLAAMREGESAGEALHARKLELFRAGAASRRWAGWIALGDPTLRAELATPSWWQRWARARKAHALGVELPAS